MKNVFNIPQIKVIPVRYNNTDPSMNLNFDSTTITGLNLTLGGEELGREPFVWDEGGGSHG
jgi:hypothetical protein